MNRSTRRGLAPTLIVVAASAAAFAAGPAAADRLRIGVAAFPSSLDPHYHNLGPNNQIAMHLFSTLLRQDPSQQLMPGLAESWEPIDETTWEFRIRQDVVFHDGTPLTAADIVCSYERAPDVPNSPAPFSTYLRGKSFEAIDDFTLHVTTAAPAPLVPIDLSVVPVVSAHAGCDASTEDFNAGRAAIGSGPYRLVSYTPGDRLILTVNEDYFGDRPDFDEVEIRGIPSDPSRVAAMLAGDVDMINVVPTADLEVLRNTPGIRLNSGLSNRVIYMHMDRWRDTSPHITANDGSPIPNPLNDYRVRRALSLAINREAITQRVMEGEAVPAGQLLPDGFFGVSPNLDPDPFDPEAARALLAEAGFPDGFRMVAHGPNDRYTNDAQTLEAIAQMLTRVGVRTSIETMTSSVFFSQASQGDEGNPAFSFFLVGWGAGSGEASSPLRSLVTTPNRDLGTGAANRGRFSDPEVDALLLEALQTVDDERREALLIEATEKAIGQLAIIPIHFQLNTWATREGISYPPHTNEATYAFRVVRD